MKAALLFLMTATAATAAPGDWNFQKAAQMMVDRQYCGINYDTSELSNEITKGALARGVQVGDGANIAANMAVALTTKIESSVGTAAYCQTRR
ncbi:hypothetical protein EV128_12276 [Rhizobium azibense]|nr:hypothetical protein EV128_12276 [Rhizobium azibense]